MRISIALCTYNGEKFLREQLDSIAEQTLLPGELVVCDDRSKDGTLKILAGFGERAPFPVQVHQNEKNLGSTRNFEKAIGLCQGDIIALCDQDDVWKPHKLERLVEILRANPEAGYVFSDAKLVDENLRPLGRRLWDSVGFNGEIKERFLKGDQFRCFTKQHIVTGATMAFRASVGRMAMPFPMSGYWIHDGWIALVSSATGALGIPVEEALISYRQHSSQQIGAPEQGEEKRKSLLGMYRELKASHQSLFAAWEKHCLQILSLKGLLRKLRDNHPSSALDQNLKCLQEFETHFLARRKILTSRGPGRYGLILREAIAGRYALFSDSWKSVFRDLFL
jgi:hypothetical protein